LEDEHLFEKIVEFINENLKGEHKTIVANGSKYLARAMTPVWTEAKKTAAEQLVQQDKYKAHVISYMHGNFDFTYWDFLPVKECENSAKIWFVNNSNKKDTLKPWMAIYGDTIKFKGIQTVNTFDGLTFSLFGVTVSIDKIQGRILIIEISPHYISIVKSMQTEKKYHGTKSVSEWDWTKANTGAGFSLTSTNGLSDYNIMEDKFALTKVSLNEKDAPHMEGKKMSTIHHSYSNTYCNVYASDLARQILFPGLFITSDSRIGSSDYAPWGAHNRAASLHDAIRNNNNGHFKSVTFDEAWRYTNKGYVVYLTAYNSRYYANNNNSVHPGHIATCYETIGYEDITDANKFLDGKIIQAGGSCGTFKFQNIWTVGNYGTNNEHVKANLYLGYIIK
jgi:hypothetical protein